MFQKQKSGRFKASDFFQCPKVLSIPVQFGAKVVEKMNFHHPLVGSSEYIHSLLNITLLLIANILFHLGMFVCIASSHSFPFC